MSKDEGKNKTKPEQKQIPATKEKQTVKTAELRDADLDKVAAGSAIVGPKGTNWKIGGGTT